MENILQMDERGRLLIALTAEQYTLIQQMIDASIDKEFEDIEFADMSDVRDAVENARSDVRGCEASIEDLERRLSNVEGER